MTNSIYLRGPRQQIRPDDYDERNEADTVTVNGVTMTVSEFRKCKSSPGRRSRGLGIYRDKDRPE